ncbi:uncharacterized protein LOC110863060 isoform X2 [Folsomia candida]|uniref:uncharacterized protein LOC110863060 isoform X2 n=1 Tax=Folsomia candida TaxID=158441 RepID=UPI00160542F5|nr:uncharacterized protein LOC110863060 isoform X2 [Folsomia candida]
MGNICPGSTKANGGARFGGHIEESQPSDLDDTPDWTQENLNAQLNELMKAMQQHNLRRMRVELETDMNTFMLNNLLMCIQFFDNFERSKDASTHFKREKESEINEKLAQSPQEGMILGERRCHLLHGMVHILAKNYIYRSPDNAGEEEYYGDYYFGSDPKNTFMSEGIIPLEFLMTWDNLELYKNSEWDMLQAMTYSSAKGSPPILRFCMEEPDNKNKIPRGYLRLRSVDVTADVYKPLTTESGYDYAYAGRFSDKASEAASDSADGLSEYSGSDVDADDLKSKMLNSRSYLHTAVSRPMGPAEPTSSGAMTSWERPRPLLAPSTPSRPSPEKNKPNPNMQRRNSGVMPTNYPQLGKLVSIKPKINLAVNEPLIPMLEIHEPTTPEISSPSPQYPYGPTSMNSLYPPTNPARPRFKGSGYDTMDGAKSRNSSVATVGSAEIRIKWQQVELKQLFQYPARKRGRADIDAEKQDPLSSNCFYPVNLEISSDEESDAEDDSDSSFESDSEKAAKEPKCETRYYLNSTQFSSEYCSEFHYMGIKGGLPPSAVNQAVVLGTSVRAAVAYNNDHEDEEPFHVTHTFTPAIHSKSWPTSYYFWFNQRMFNRKNRSELDDRWPSADQVEKIEKLGSNAVPLGFRPIEFFNTHQSLEWQVNFLPAESLLFDSFKSVHWRVYIFAAIIFRAFIAPLGPQGIGVEHIRNIIYFMCHEDFVGWNDEQPGVHLRAVISKLFDCLGKGKMPNFFIQSQDLLKSIPTQNSRLVQAHLSKLKDNLVVYCIYAFRNLTVVQPEDTFYPMPNFKKLYNIITVPHERDLLQINTPGLGLGGMSTMDDEVRPKKANRNKKKPKIDLELLEKEDAIEGEFRALSVTRPVEKPDKMQRKLRKRHLDYKLKMEEIAREQKNKKLSPDDKIPLSERRKSIDLKQSPIIQEKFSPLRKVLVIEFFIKHFINMAKKSNEFRAYSQSAMYIMQVENLCAILLEGNYDFGQTTLDEETIEEYKKKCEVLREVVGKEMRDYVLARFSHLNLPTLTNHTHNVFGEWSKNRTFHNNWDFRKLPTPPGSHVDPAEFEQMVQKQQTHKELRKIPPTNKKLETPNIARTLQSIQPLSPIPSEASSAKLARRAESIKFIDKPVGMKKSASRQSIILVDEFESTDL